MIGRTVIAIALAGFLGSCTRIIDVRAVFQGTALTFVGDDDDETFHPWCLSNFAVVRSDGVDAWRFEVPLDKRHGKKKCGPNLPIAYGTAPVDANIITPSRRLEHGHVYIITGHGGGMYEGAFRFLRESGGILRVLKVTPDPQTISRALSTSQDAIKRPDPANTEGPDEQTTVWPPD